MKQLLAGAVAILLAFAAAPVLTAEGTPGAAPGKDMAAGKEKFEQWCKANPEKCKELKARHEACKADPEKCKAERQARREEWCKANPEKCKEMQARREACKADPEKCKAERKAKREQWCKDNPERCAEKKARTEERGKK